MKKRTFVLIITFLLVVYISLFPLKLDTPPRIVPVWRITMDEKTPSIGTGQNESIPFRTELHYGYHDSGGDILHTGRILSNVALGSSLYANYSHVAQGLVFFQPKGGPQFVLDLYDYPFFRGDRLFTVSTDRKKISEWDLEGKLIWSQRLLSPVSFLETGRDRIMVGRLNGEVDIMTAEGKVDYTLYPEKSKIPAAYAGTLSPTEEYVATVTGLSPQRLVLFHTEKGPAKAVWEKEIEPPFRRNLLLSFSKDALFYETSAGIAYRELNGYEGSFNTVGTPFHIEYIEEAGVLVFICSQEATTSLYCFSSRGDLLFFNRFSGQIHSFEQRKRQIYLSLGESVWRLDL